MIKRAKYLRQMLRNETRDAQSLRRAQSDALNRLVQHVATQVPFYRNLYRDHGIDLNVFDAERDMQVLPIVDKHGLREAGSLAHWSGGGQSVTIRTSGSTGEPFVFDIDPDYDQWRKAQYLRPYLRCGRRLRDKVLRLTAFPLQRRPLFAWMGVLREWQVDCAMPASELQAKWQALRPHVLQGYPSALRTLANYCLESGRSLTPAPRMVFTDSELLMPDTRALLQRAFDADVSDIFGTYETDNIAWQCGRSDSYHVATDCVLLEIVRDGKPVEPGEQGEIVVTALGNRTTPFVRYNLRDLGQWATHVCSCGSPFPLLTRLVGRADDLIRMDDGSTRTSMDILGRLDRYAGLVRHYQLRQIAAHRFELHIVPARHFQDTDGAEVVGAVRRSLPRAEVVLKLVEAIAPQRSGKRLAFVRA